jgi:hypothetical protein
MRLNDFSGIPTNYYRNSYFKNYSFSVTSKSPLMKILHENFPDSPFERQVFKLTATSFPEPLPDGRIHNVFSINAEKNMIYFLSIITSGFHHRRRLWTFRGLILKII